MFDQILNCLVQSRLLCRAQVFGCIFDILRQSGWLLIRTYMLQKAIQNQLSIELCLRIVGHLSHDRFHSFQAWFEFQCILARFAWFLISTRANGPDLYLKGFTVIGRSWMLLLKILIPKQGSSGLIKFKFR